MKRAWILLPIILVAAIVIVVAVRLGSETSIEEPRATSQTVNPESGENEAFADLPAETVFPESPLDDEPTQDDEENIETNDSSDVQTVTITDEYLIITDENQSVGGF